MEPRSEPPNTVWSFPFTPQDWEQTPPAVQVYVRTLSDEVAQLHDRVETLGARLTRNSTTSSKPPSPRAANAARALREMFLLVRIWEGLSA